ncbi:TIGR00269 family protein [Candidatus Bathyarchaeota archaeon]|nr:TIGR00269 family protein [Candidatus Bathyarchaeota archaeon]
MGDTILCSRCGRGAFYLQPYSGNSFCRRCYIQALEKRVRDHINQQRLLRPNDRIAVAVSGGKDSVSLLHILVQIEEEFPKAELVAVSIDEGIEGYRSEALEIAAKNAAKLGVEHHILSFESIYGHRLEEIAQIALTRGKFSICAYCGILRRKALNVLAKKVDASVLVTAHNLDDEAQSVLMSIVRGDANLFVQQQSQVDSFVRRAKPFSSIPEREVVLYAYLRGICFQSISCPYAGTSLRNDARVFLDIMEEKHPGMKFNVQATLRHLQLMKGSKGGGIQVCESCGEPSSTVLCRSCQVLQELGLSQ